MENSTSTPTKKSAKKFYIGFRGNPQLKSGGYYVGYGQLSKKDAKEKEKCVYGSLHMTSILDTEEQYNDKIKELETQGHKVNKR
jgi:hypothetical protein